MFFIYLFFLHCVVLCRCVQLLICCFIYSAVCSRSECTSVFVLTSASCCNSSICRARRHSTFFFFCNVREICSHGKETCLINQKFVARLLPLPCCSAHKQHVAASEFCHLQMRQQLSVGRRPVLDDSYRDILSTSFSQLFSACCLFCRDEK